MTGILQSWHANGFGMVAVGQQLYFLHRTNIAKGEWIRPQVGSIVEFEIGPAYKNGTFPQCINATVMTQAEKAEPKAGA